jgi:hypothetical protein
MCLRSAAEDAYVALALAESYGAMEDPACACLVRAGMKSLKVLEDEKAEAKRRCAAGDRAARKFWEAKVCARSGPRLSR